MILPPPTGNALLDYLLINYMARDLYNDAQALVDLNQDIIKDKADIEHDMAALAAQQAELANDKASLAASSALLDDLKDQWRDIRDQLDADQSNIKSLQKAIKSAKGAVLVDLQAQLTQAKAAYAADKAASDLIHDNLEHQKDIQSHLVHEVRHDQERLNDIQRDLAHDQRDLLHDTAKFNRLVVDFKGDADQLAKLVADYKLVGGTATSVHFNDDGHSVTIDMTLLGSDVYNALLQSFTGQTLSVLDQVLLKANNDTVTIDGFTPNNAIDVLAQDVLTPNAVIVADAQGVVATSADGVQVTLVNGKLDYAPGAQFLHLALGQQAHDTFSYTISDGINSSTASVSVTINGLYVPPSVMDIQPPDIDKSAALSHIAFVGVENAPGSSLTYSVVSDTNVTALSDTTYQVSGGGILINHGDGTFSYTPDSTFQYLGQGAVETVSFHYVATDGYATSTTGLVTINIDGHAGAPTLDPIGAGDITGALDVNGVPHTYDNNIIFSGTGDIGDTIRLDFAYTASNPGGIGAWNNGTGSGSGFGSTGLSAQIVVDQTGHWSYTASGLADGSYSVSATDITNNLIAASSNAVVVDTHAPDAPGITDVIPVSRDAFSIHGTVPVQEAGGIVGLYDNGQLLSTGIADAQGHWVMSVDSQYMADNLLFNTTDLAGNVSAMGFIPLTAQSFTLPNTIYSNQSLTNQQLDGIYLHPRTDLVYSLVVDGVYIATQPINGVYTLTNGATVSLGTYGATNGSFDFNPNGAYGDMHFDYQVQDLFGHVSNIGTVSLHVNPVPVTINDLPQTLPNQALDYINSTTLTLSGTAQPGAVVELLSPEMVLNPVTALASGQWSTTFMVPGDGTYHFIANAIGFSSFASMTVHVDTHIPTAPQISSIQANVDGSYTVTGFATSAIESQDLVQAYDGNVLVGSAHFHTDGDGLWSMVIPGVNVANDNLHWNFTSLAGTVGADGYIPVVAQNVNIATLSAFNGGQPGIYAEQFSVSDINPAQHLSYNILVDGTHVVSQSGNQYTMADGVVITNNNDGSFLINAVGAASHLASGQVASESFSYQVMDGPSISNIGTVNFSVLDNAYPPHINDLALQYDTGPTHAANYTNLSSFVLTGTGGQDMTLSIVSQPQGMQAMLNPASFTMDANGNWSEAVTINTFYPTAGDVVFRASDAFGDASSLSVHYSNMIPAAPVLTSDFHSGTSMVFGGTALANSQIDVFNGAIHVGSALTNSIGDWSTTVSGAPISGDLTFSVTDQYGNVSAATPEPTISAMVDPTNPALFDLNAANDNVSSLIVKYQLHEEVSNPNTTVVTSTVNGTLTLTPGQTGTIDMSAVLESNATSGSTINITLSILSDPAYHIDSALGSAFMSYTATSETGGGLGGGGKGGGISLV